MVLGFRFKTNWGSGMLLCLLSWGLLAAEIHGILGHTHSEQSGASRHVEKRGSPADFQLASFNGDVEDPPCSLCYCFRLLHQTLIPEPACLVDSFFVAQAITVQRTCLVQSDTPQEGNRGPPVAW